MGEEEKEKRKGGMVFWGTFTEEVLDKITISRILYPKG